MVTEVVSGFLGKVASCQRRTNTRRVGNIGATIWDKVTVKPTPEVTEPNGVHQYHTGIRATTVFTEQP